MQNCQQCKENKPLSAYEKYNTGNYRGTCKLCRNRQIIINIEKNKDKILQIQSTIKNKTCTKCNLNKNISEFNKLIRSQDGYCNLCKGCYKLTRKPKNDNSVLNANLNKACITCSYVGNNFRKNLKSLDSYFNQCNNCWKPIEWNKEKQHASYKKYYDNNKDKMKAKWDRHAKKINRRIRSALNSRIKGCLFSKKLRTFEYTGCNNVFLKKWFEFLFEENMSWNNYGEWHIDHIKPCSSYDFNNEQEIFTCFNWQNLRPCWKKYNLEKSGKIDNELIAFYKEKAELFSKNNPTTKSDTKLSDGSIEKIEV